MTAMISSGVAVLLLGTAAFYAASAASDADDVNRLVNYRSEIGRPLTVLGRRRPVRQATADGSVHDRNAKIALSQPGAPRRTRPCFFVLDAKLGGEPAVAVAPAGAGVAATGGWTWRF